MVIPDMKYIVETEDESIPVAISQDKAIIIYGFNLRFPHAEHKGMTSWRDETTPNESNDIKDLRKKMKNKMTDDMKKEIQNHLESLKKNMPAKPPKGTEKDKQKDTHPPPVDFSLNIGGLRQTYKDEESKKRLLTMLESVAEENKERAQNNDKETATVEIEKDMDSTTTLFHRLYMQYNRLEGKETVKTIKLIEVWFFHRRTKKDAKEAKTLPFSAYFFYDCRIVGDGIASDDNDIPTEHLTISFSKVSIHNWNTSPNSEKEPKLTSLDWDFVPNAKPAFTGYKKPGAF
jgi:hypothetical protein